MKKLIALFIPAILSTNVSATHIIGGEMFYDCLGNNNYRITLKLYRDCFLGQAPYDSPANIGVFRNNGTLFTNVQVAFPGAVKVPYTGNNPCYQVPPSICVEEAVYVTVVNLPPYGGDYTLAYQRCCRNNSIINIVSPESTGATYVQTIRPEACNNSPRFNNFPPIAICIGDELIFDHSATDPDGDEIVYQLCSTFSGGTPQNPMPIPPSAPPYNPIIFQAPYTVNFPIATNPPISLDPQTGELKVKPTALGQYVVGVCALEYRNGVLIGTHQRDFQFNVINCLSNVVADFSMTGGIINDDGVIVNCSSQLVNFQNQSVNANIFQWFFNPMGDQSSAVNPSYEFPGVGQYEVTLIANPGYFCADTITKPVLINHQVSAFFEADSIYCFDGHIINLIGTGNYSDAALFSWDTNGSTATPFSNTNTFNNLIFNEPGTYNISFNISDLGCFATYSRQITLIGKTEYDWEILGAEGCPPLTVQFVNNSQTSNAPLTFTWNFGDGNTSNAFSPTHTYSAGSSYNVSLTVTDDSGCNQNYFLELLNAIQLRPKPIAGFSLSPEETSIFQSKISFFDESIGANSCLYHTGTGDILNFCNGIYEYLDYGLFKVMQVVFNEYNCTDTTYRFVNILPEYAFYIPNAFTINGDDINDIFLPKGVGIEEYELIIFNRWGEELFRTNDPKKGWSGIDKNLEPQPQGVYVYKISITDAFRKQHNYIGMINLIR